MNRQLQMDRNRLHPKRTKLGAFQSEASHPHRACGPSRAARTRACCLSLARANGRPPLHRRPRWRSIRSHRGGERQSHVGAGARPGWGPRGIRRGPRAGAATTPPPQQTLSPQGPGPHGRVSFSRIRPTCRYADGGAPWRGGVRPCVLWF